ncbi:glycosyltransferase [Micromonospora peucetia]|uniref:glycosyltransferase n=1 Tax=Micromonospora peucetia TaxID=47871 RepID=UPI003320DD0D
MRIGIDATAIRPGHSAGVEAFTYGLVNGLAAGPHELAVRTLAGTGDEWHRRVTGGRISWSEVSLALRTDNGVGRFLRRHTPNRLHSSVVVRRTLNLIRQRGRHGTGVDCDVTVYPFHAAPVDSDPAVVVLHDLRQFQPDFGSAGYRDVIRRNVERAAAIVVSWPHPYQQTLETFPAARDKTVLIPPPTFHSAPKHPQVEPEPGLLVYPSSTAPHKNHETLVEAMALLPECRLVCPGPLVEPVASRLRARVRGSDLRGRVHFPGFVAVPELDRLYSRAAAVVVPSLWEAASGAVFEAFSWGLPVVCADVPPLRAQLEFARAEAGLFAPRDPAALAVAVRQVLADRDRYADAARAASNRLAGRTWTDTARDYTAILEWVRDGGTGPLPRSPFVAGLTDLEGAV